MGEHVAVTLIAFIIATIVGASFAAVAAWWLQRQGWDRDELELKRDVLRRLLGYRYRLIEGLGRDGEPFIALNGARLVYWDAPEVIRALRQMQDDMEAKSEGRLAQNLTAVVKAMAGETRIDTKDIDQAIVETPFVFPR